MNELKQMWDLTLLALKGELPLEIFLSESKTIPGLRLLLLLMRWLILLGVWLRLALNRGFYDSPEQMWRLRVLWPSLLLFLVYTATISAIELSRPRSRDAKAYLAFQVVFDVAFFSLFYYLTGKEESDFFLFYLLPVSVTIEHSNFRGLLRTLILCLVGFGTVTVMLQSELSRSLGDLLAQVYMPRAMFLVFVGVVGLFLQSTARVQKQTLLSLLDTLKGGISVISGDMRLVWMNKFERELAPTAWPGDTCFRVFHGRDTICPSCSVDAVFKTGQVSKCEVAHTIAGEDHLYELTSGPLNDERGRTIAAISVMNDITLHRRRSNVLRILHDVGSFMRVTEIDQPERIEEMLWRTLAGVVATDGLAFERALLMVVDRGALRGGLGIGPIDAQEAQAQRRAWENTGLPWTYDTIGGMRSDPRVRSTRLNQALTQFAIAEQGIRDLELALQFGDEPKPRLCSRAAQGDRVAQLLMAAFPAEIQCDWALVAPLVVRGRLLGLLLADTVLNPHRTTPQDEWADFLQLFANQAAIALDSSAALARSRARLRELDVLNRISNEIARKQTDMPALLGAIAQQATELLGANGANLFLCDPKHRKVRVVVSHRLDALRGFEQDYGTGVAGRVAVTGQPMIWNDYHKWPENDPALDKPPYRDLLRHIISVPLRWEDQVIAILSVVQSAPERRFQEDDLKRLERLASIAAVALGHAQLYSELQTIIDNSPAAIVAVNAEDQIRQFNRACEQITGWRRDDMIGHPVAEFYRDGKAEAQRINSLLIDRESSDGKISNIRSAVRDRRGESVPIRLTAALLRDGFGKQAGSIGLMTDLRDIEVQAADYRSQQDLLAQLQLEPPYTPIADLAGLQERLRILLRMAADSCRVKYLVLFASTRESDTVLQAVAHVGLPDHIASQPPHFNWRKAGLLPPGANQEAILLEEAEKIRGWRPDRGWRETVVSGIRGAHSDFFVSVTLGVPVRLAENYRAILVFGPMEGAPDPLQMADFLRNMGQTININALSWLQALHLRAKQVESQTSAELIAHRTTMWLTALMGKFGRISKTPGLPQSAQGLAREGEDLAHNTAGIIRRALRARYSGLEPEDFVFRDYSLSVLVQNCAENFTESARSKACRIDVDPSIELLPYAEGDVELLSTALGNLIENAVKYSRPDTPIRLSAGHDGKEATIWVDDLGEPMPESARANLAVPGKRWAMSAHAHREIPGSGLGLWDANMIVTAHGGRLDFTSLPEKLGQDLSAHRTRVWMTLPLQLKQRS